MLKTEQNTPQISKKIKAAAVKRFGRRSNPQPWFEHGQWWITFVNGANYSVVDAEGGSSIDGFDFEQVSDGEY